MNDHSPKVLILDHETYSRIITARFFRELGCEVIEAKHVLHALQSLEKSELNWFVVITDWTMPKVGKDFLRLAISMKPLVQNWILSTAISPSDPEIKKLLTEHSEVIYLPKPFSAMRLISAVSEDKNLIERREPKPYELEIARVALGSEIKKYRQPDGSEQWNYFLDGILRMRATIRNGERHGSFELFYPNGFVWIKGGYKDNEPADDWEAFLPNGEKLD